MISYFEFKKDKLFIFLNNCKRNCFFCWYKNTKQFTFFNFYEFKKMVKKIKNIKEIEYFFCDFFSKSYIKTVFHFLRKQYPNSKHIIHLLNDPKKIIPKKISTIKLNLIGSPLNVIYPQKFDNIINYSKRNGIKVEFVIIAHSGINISDLIYYHKYLKKSKIYIVKKDELKYKNIVKYLKSIGFNFFEINDQPNDI